MLVGKMNDDEWTNVESHDLEGSRGLKIKKEGEL